MRARLGSKLVKSQCVNTRITTRLQPDTCHPERSARPRNSRPRFSRRDAFRYVSELPSFLAKQPSYGDAFDAVVLANVGDFRSGTARTLLLGDNNALALEQCLLSSRVLDDGQRNNERVGIRYFFRRINQGWKVAQNLLRALDLLNLLLTKNFRCFLTHLRRSSSFFSISRRTSRGAIR